MADVPTRDWLEQVIALEDQGRFREASALHKRSVTPQQWSDWLKSSRALADTIARIDFNETQAILDRLVASRELPEGEAKRNAWEVIAGLTPRQAAKIWRYLPDPLKRRGRPRGSGPIAKNSTLFGEIDRLQASGLSVTEAIKKAVPEGRTNPKNRRDHVLKAYRSRGKKPA